MAALPTWTRRRGCRLLALVGTDSRPLVSTLSSTRSPASTRALWGSRREWSTRARWRWRPPQADSTSFSRRVRCSRARGFHRLAAAAASAWTPCQWICGAASTWHRRLLPREDPCFRWAMWLACHLSTPLPLRVVWHHHLLPHQRQRLRLRLHQRLRQRRHRRRCWGGSFWALVSWEWGSRARWQAHRGGGRWLCLRCE